MIKNLSKAVLVALCLLMGCGRSEVRTGSRKPGTLPLDATQTSGDALKTSPNPNGDPETASASGQTVGTEGKSASENASNTSGQSNQTPEAGKDSGSPSDEVVGAPNGQASGPVTDLPSGSTPPGAPGVPAPAPEVPLPPSKLGWNGTQAIGTAQLYFLPLD